MKKYDVFNKLHILFLVSLLFTLSTAAQVGIGTTTPAGGSILDLTSADKGFLVPRVNIADLATINPITGGATVGLFVWNTNAGTGIGYHYWNGTRWIPIGNGGVDWALGGNNIVATNFLGTTNNQPLNIRTNNLERMRVQNNGLTTVGFGANPANAGDAFSAMGLTGVAGYSGGNREGVYGQNIGSGNAVYGINNSTGNAISGLNIGTGPGVYGENFFFTNYSVHAVDGIASVYADNSTFGYDGVVGLTDDDVSNAIWGINENISGVAILGGVNGLHVYPSGGTGVSGSGPTLGIYGYAGNGARTIANRGNAAGVFSLDTDSNPSTNGANNGTRAYAKLADFDNVTPNGTLANSDSYFGGYFSGGNQNSGTPSYVYVGIKYATNNNGTTGTDFKIVGNGSVSTMIRDTNNKNRILFAPEAPEILFEDYGTGKLINGVAQITIDPILKDAIYVDDKHPLKVFIQLEGECNGVYVTNKSANGFTVKELQGGNSNVPFSWHIVANRADTKDASGQVTSKHVGLRLPIGPGPLDPTQSESRKVLELKDEPSPKKKDYEQEIDATKRIEVPSRSSK